MSEELCNRVHKDNKLVWTDIREAQQLKNMTKPAELESEFEFITKEHSSVSSLIFADVAQFTVNGEGTVSSVTEQNYYEDDYEWEERQSDYFEDFDHVRVKPIDFPKLRYPRPLKSTLRQHGTNRNCRSDKTKDVGERNELLPKIIFDASTTAILEKFIENTYIGQYNDVIGRGKNSVVFHADAAICPRGRRRGTMLMPCSNAVKVYKTGSNKENNELVYKRVQREFEHLKILYSYKFPFANSPWPVRAFGNVIIMSSHGNETIQDVTPGNDHYTYHRIIHFIDKYYNEKHLVHGSLSPKKILWGICGEPYFIGWSHSVKSDHPQAHSKLMRDCNFVTEFYAKRGVKLELTTEDLFKKITKVSKISSELLKMINKDLYKKYDTNPNRTPRLTEPNNNGILRFKKK